MKGSLMNDNCASRLLKLLSVLRKKNIMFRLEQQSDDAIMVSFAFAGMRIEVEVFEDRLEFSTFSGDESVDLDESRLYRLIEKHWSDD